MACCKTTRLVRLFSQQTSIYYPLVNIQKTMGNQHFFMGKSTISMAIFNSKLLVYRSLGGVSSCPPREHRRVPFFSVLYIYGSIYIYIYIWMVIPPYQLVIYPITFPFVGEFGYTFIQGCCQHLRPPCGYHLSVMDWSKPAIFSQIVTHPKIHSHPRVDSDRDISIDRIIYYSDL